MAQHRMLQDSTVEGYVMWTKFEEQDALIIPDVEAFVVNVLPKHFKDMKKVYAIVVLEQITCDLTFYQSGAAFRNS